MGIRKSSGQSGLNNIGGVVKTGSLPPGAPHHGCALNTQSFLSFLRPSVHDIYIYIYTRIRPMYTYTSYSIHILYNNVNLPSPPPPTSTARGCDPPNVSRSERGAKKKVKWSAFRPDRGAIDKRSDVWFFRLFCPGFPKFFPSTIPPPSPRSPKLHSPI